MRVKVIQHNNGMAKVICADTGELITGIHKLIFEASTIGSVLTLQMIDFDVDIEAEAQIEDSTGL